MKKKLLLGFGALIVIVAIGQALGIIKPEEKETQSTPLPTPTPIVQQKADSPTKETPSPSPEASPTQELLSPSPEASPTSEPSEKVTPTDLFETVYFPYANREKSFLFEAVKTFVQTTEYNVTIVEPTSEIMGTIELTDEDDNSVYFAFDFTNNVETIMTVSYYNSKTNSEVSLNNYSTDGLPKYDKFTAHVIGEESIVLNNPDEQRDFLFH